jgi:hypothetical protein
LLENEKLLQELDKMIQEFSATVIRPFEEYEKMFCKAIESIYERMQNGKITTISERLKSFLEEYVFIAKNLYKNTILRAMESSCTVWADVQELIKKQLTGNDLYQILANEASFLSSLYEKKFQPTNPQLVTMVRHKLDSLVTEFSNFQMKSIAVVEDYLNKVNSYFYCRQFIFFIDS